MSLLKERGQGHISEVTQRRVENRVSGTGAVSKSQILDPRPIFTAKKGELTVVSFTDPQPTDQVSGIHAARDDKSIFSRIFRRGTSNTAKTEVVDEKAKQPTPSGGTDDGGEPPTDNGGVEDSGWDENDHRVAAIIGAERVAAVVSLSRHLRRFTELVKTPDPYKVERPHETIMNDDTTHAIAVIKETNDRYYEIKSERDTQGLRSQVSNLREAALNVPIIQSAFLNTNSSHKATLQALVVMKLPQSVTIQRPSESTVPVEEFLDTAGQIYRNLTILATSVPTKNVLVELKEVLTNEAIASTVDSYAIGRSLRSMRRKVQELDAIPVAERGSHGSQNERCKDLELDIMVAGQRDKAFTVTHRSSEQRKRDKSVLDSMVASYPKLIKTGSIIYRELNKKVTEGAIGSLADMHKVLSSVQSHLDSYGDGQQSPDQLAKVDLEKAAIVEDYLIEKAGFLEDSYRQIRGRVPTNIRKELRTYQQKKFGPALRRLGARDGGAEEHLELPDDFRRDTGLVRDIVIGGGRIKAENARPLANALYALRTDEGEELLPPAARGLIVSLATETFRLDPVLRVMDEFSRVNGGDGSTLLRALHQNIPERYAAISQFDRTSLLESVELVQDILRNQSTETAVVDSLDQTVGSDRLETVRRGLTAIRNRLLERSATIDLENYERLDWTVLPEGTLRESAIDIIEKVRARSKNPDAIEIDLSRLTILEELREAWNKGKTYYARGTLGQRRAVKTRDGSHEPEEYIILVLQYTDATGTMREHAIAESPITGRNALYVHRADISEDVWQEIFSLPKDLATGFGARALNHRKRGGKSLNESMVEKTTLLLNCTPQDFRETRIDRL